MPALCVSSDSVVNLNTRRCTNRDVRNRMLSAEKVSVMLGHVAIARLDFESRAAKVSSLYIPNYMRRLAAHNPMCEE